MRDETVEEGSERERKAVVKTRTAKETRVAADVGEMAWWASGLDFWSLVNSTRRLRPSAKSCAGQAGTAALRPRPCPNYGVPVGLCRHMATFWYATAKSILALISAHPLVALSIAK